MTTKALENLWQLYPDCHLHCDVARAGQDSYRIVVSLIDNTGEVVASSDYYGSGDLDTLKECAFEGLAKELQSVVPCCEGANPTQ
jgi:hypothetical protein